MDPDVLSMEVVNAMVDEAQRNLDVKRNHHITLNTFLLASLFFKVGCFARAVEATYAPCDV